MGSLRGSEQCSDEVAVAEEREVGRNGKEAVDNKVVNMEDVDQLQEFACSQHVLQLARVASQWKTSLLWGHMVHHPRSTQSCQPPPRTSPTPRQRSRSLAVADLAFLKKQGSGHTLNYEMQWQQWMVV